MKNKFWKNINFNKWKKTMPDCLIRAICGGIGFDYEIACMKLGVDCKPGEGFKDSYGIDLDLIHDKFNQYLGPMQDMMDMYDDPADALLNGITLNDWLVLHKDDNKMYLIYLDDNKAMDGGHIVCAKCKGSDTYFIDTFDCGNMFVLAFCLIAKRVPKESKLHWKYDKVSKSFI